MVAIIDYGMGNVASVQKALNFLSVKNVITDDHDAIKAADIILLPGVGSFAQGMKNLQERNLIELLKDEVMVKKKKFLGICLGMQLIMEKGIEPHECEGLGWIEGQVVKFELEHLNVPHMGWNNIDVLNNTYYENCETKDFYFIHSYHVLPKNKIDIAATVDYGFDVVASIQRGNIFATQFHPEKSQNAGLAILKTFFGINA
ncbi:imidazole glycerol phosphate synthase subunit HisH [Pedobacter sp. LMG 31464]|uniref:Imidazole glycerol phosphate synthase subunit HisH n=1 Tax=Pedobacter planticolens TaxID=2679964 RepID=A0A923IX48_9SPHI|nr:imidazole glycerol phosphate synthase subunit HisH [Pedobacter planticolens]MBB2145932.1 imidazole glycerol phosphate synthase subunit HisH [Pedobacter planticolens]